MELAVVTVEFCDNEVYRRDTPKIRGYISSKFPENIELHHHTDKGFLYQYPLIQYKTIYGKPFIVGIQKGAEILKEIEPQLTEIRILGERQEIYEKSIKFGYHDFGIAQGFHYYRFVTPWMALNQNNYNKYNQYDDYQKTELLKKILIGNFLSISKTLGYHVNQRIDVMLQVKPILMNFKNQRMLAFNGSFLSNFDIPDYFGIGKSVSRGFGTVVKQTEDCYR